ncbi:hypothetical protein [Phormidium sp. FACHB-1136]|uniref:hypothetical protein n=1 Tax=Phormidium sp. FACHB-1136 TaxID=2692848 RepID=UPI00168929CE|nr:hypothetical protein [Phormidium sp. FACHB-1136]MBD2425250.1 hypothetical protein [Phormidium sp. FACHB-1136]
MRRVHPIWWLVGVVVAVSVGPRLLYSVDPVQRLAVKDGNIEHVDRYTETLERLDQACTEDKEAILNMNIEIAEHWMKSDPEAKYLDALVTMSNVVIWVGYIKPPNNCTQAYQGMIQLDRQVHY